MDTQPKQILILHGSAGFGHQKAAEALAGALAKRAPGVKIDVRDALDYFPPWLKRLYAGIYLFLINRAPLVWGLNYTFFDCRLVAPVVDFARRHLNGIMARGLARTLLEEKPDVVFCTHFLSAEIIADLKRRRKFAGRSVTVITDFLVHRFWVFRETDLYAVATEKTKEALVGMGIDAGRIAVTGIPVDAKFARTGDRSSVAARLGLRPDAFTVLLTSGGVGSGPMLEALRGVIAAGPRIQIAVIAGRNEAFKAEAESIARGRDNIKVFGFVNNMDEFMDASDVIVGKGGGLTLSEALAKQKIFFIISPVPGQEIHNAACLDALGASVWVRSLPELERRLKELAENPALREKYRQAIARVARPDSASRVAEAGLALAEGQVPGTRGTSS